MKTSVKLFALGMILMGFGANSFAQVTENTDAKARILTALTISETQYLEFGSMGVLAGTPGTCVVSTAGVRSVTQGVTGSSLGTAPKAAAYEVSGEATYTYSILLPASITIKRESGSEIMTIGTLLAKAVSGTESHTATGTLGSDGKDTFTVGGTLSVAAGQKEGAYAGTFDVTVNYN